MSVDVETRPCHFCGDEDPHRCCCMYECEICGEIGHEHRGLDHPYDNDYERELKLDPRTHARASDPSTSHAAAQQLGDKTTMMRRLLQAYQVLGPLTADEAATHVGYGPESGAWKRVSDLAAQGLITNTHQIRPGRSGRGQRVRAITEAGRKELSR